MALRALCLTLSLLPAVSAGAAPTVVLDPGHGGSNSGALGPEARIYEKRLTLILARRTQSFIEQWVPGVKVVLTRTQDEYLTLAERARKANAARADLFVSIHCNASESRSSSGFQSFILSREASDQESARLAQAENRGTGPEPPATPEVVRAILRDLQHSAHHAASAELASAMQRALRVARGAQLDQGIRQAPFDVLLGLRMPGVLVEVGYIDHPVEGRDLLRPHVQEQIAVALATAIVERLLVL
jgi:N-acetylmuramoyl-L-alanine amidase